ncbi:polysaccharide biosynthesis protein [Petroclostridium xylanilyticum]|uniref:polysaccharide biosynthesis protein n=1 Tax=Petroclostridium xylanilyticum TaxID=1792311 RepID=UPI000B997D38|nr:nucleoside-diphosphate sugar epimerase/dehydratase [Petroclostridium xylanilyticum]
MLNCSSRTILRFSVYKLFLLTTDIILINLATYIALFFRFDGKIPVQYINIYMNTFIWLTLIKISVYYIFRLYTSLWKYASIEELLQIFFATLTGAVGSVAFGVVTHLTLPRTVYAISWMLTFLLIGASRLSYRIIRKLKNAPFINGTAKKRVMVVGAGYTGSMVIKELKKRPELKSTPVVIIDDDEKKHGSHIHGLTVKGDKRKIQEIAEQYRIDEIIIAIPSATRSQLKEILDECKKTRCKLKTLPALHELINGQVDINQIRDVNIEDLLGREPITLNTQEISGYLKDEVVLVTGGGGSIGSELCRQIARFEPRKLIIFDIYENNAYDLENELKFIYKEQLDLEVLIGSVQDKKRLEYVFGTYKPGVVFHAAAHKHVPLMEGSPTEAIKNNVFGTLNTAECADEYGVKKFVLISTDKAVNPTNVMGATKRIAEMIIQNMSRHSRTEFAAVRFGNVLGSNGSVIPLFKKQIAQGGPVTVTHPEITRYFMTIPEAAQLVIQAGAMAKGGEIFILDMGQPVKIVDLAKDLIRLSGLEPDIDIEIRFTGLRPGEKLYEELLMAEEGLTATKHEKIFIGKPVHIDHKKLMQEINSLRGLIFGSGEDISDYIERLVPTYSKVG